MILKNIWERKPFFFLFWSFLPLFLSSSYSSLVVVLDHLAALLHTSPFPSTPWFSGVPSSLVPSFQNLFRNMLSNILTTCPAHPNLHFTRSLPSRCQQSSPICRRIQTTLTCVDPNILRRTFLTKEATILQHSGQTSVFYSHAAQLVGGATPPSVPMYPVAQAVNRTGPVWRLNSAAHFLRRPPTAVALHANTIATWQLETTASLWRFRRLSEASLLISLRLPPTLRPTLLFPPLPLPAH